MESIGQNKQQSLNFNKHCWQWNVDKSECPQDEREFYPLPAIQCIPIEKQFQKYMGSKKDDKFRFLMLDVGIKVDFQEMTYYGTSKFLQQKPIERKKIGEIEGKDVKIFFQQLYPWLLSRKTALDSPPYLRSWVKINQMKVPSIKDVINGIIEHNLYKIKRSVDEISYEVTKEEINEGQNTLRSFWMDIIKQAKFQNIDLPIKSQDIMDPENKVCKLIFFLYSLHYDGWEKDWRGELFIEDQKSLGQLKEQDQQNFQFLSPFSIALNMGAIHSQQKRKDKKPGPYKLFAGQISTKEFATKLVQNFQNKQEIFFQGFQSFTLDENLIMDNLINCFYLQKNQIEGIRMSAFIIQIDVENPENLDHFFMDKEDYSVCPSDGEVFVGEYNLYKIKDIQVVDHSTDVLGNIRVILEPLTHPKIDWINLENDAHNFQKRKIKK